MGAPTVVYTEIGAGEFVQADPEAETIARLDIGILVRTGFGEGLGVRKHHTAEQTITSDAEAVFGFQVEHIEAAIAALDIAPAGIAVGVPAGAREEKVGGTPVAQREPVVTPEGKDIVAARREVTDREGIYFRASITREAQLLSLPRKVKLGR